MGVEIVAEAPLLTAMWQKGEDSTNLQDNHIVKPPFELFGKCASGGFHDAENCVGCFLSNVPFRPLFMMRQYEYDIPFEGTDEGKVQFLNNGLHEGC